MKDTKFKAQYAGDRVAIGLSAVCILHCLALPLVLVLFPSLALVSLDDELFHHLMLFAVLPVSVVTLILGYRHHNEKSVFLIGLLGLAVLTGIAFVDHDHFGHWGETVFTVTGSLILAYAHLRNARMRRLLSHQQKPDAA